ncbi:hypothetical protein [Mycobacteroides abscessus]|uniref:hypothetical protein n=1 Tax=Mycobacteroides abscessus TaxID=36809 RepID=UPI000927E757|nr:hypothetical protein [Mycobacteroides abscessus]SHZ38513.1 Uncharacterised protein [Mycobacteroides abscessus subsp. abscessus]SHZ40380.1 Uncharacterised protein [Mycobacteroides abscessus subsp. abscessus]SKT22130.1 Uncharacterised protein [Mycobacteroides abscessus subsp. bolletii]
MITPDAKLISPVVSEEDIPGPARHLKIVKLTLVSPPGRIEVSRIRWTLIVSGQFAGAYADFWYNGRWNEIWELTDVTCKSSSIDKDPYDKVEDWTYVLDLLADYVSNVLRIERGDQ